MVALKIVNGVTPGTLEFMKNNFPDGWVESGSDYPYNVSVELYCDDQSLCGVGAYTLSDLRPIVYIRSLVW